MKRILAITFVFVVLISSVFVDSEPTPKILYVLWGGFLLFALIWGIVYFFRKYVEKENLK